MFLTSEDSIREVILFPTLKRKVSVAAARGEVKADEDGDAIEPEKKEEKSVEKKEEKVEEKK